MELKLTIQICPHCARVTTSRDDESATTETDTEPSPIPNDVKLDTLWDRIDRKEDLTPKEQRLLFDELSKGCHLKTRQRLYAAIYRIPLSKWINSKTYHKIKIYNNTVHVEYNYYRDSEVWSLRSTVCTNAERILKP